jgi:hypothetical protein
MQLQHLMTVLNDSERTVRYPEIMVSRPVVPICLRAS